MYVIAILLPLLYVIFETKLLSNDTKIKILQTGVYITTFTALIFSWHLGLFLIGLALGWIFWLTGIHGSLHKYSSHKCFTAKNKLAEFFILFMGTIVSLGSNISWASTHRKHHLYSDQEGDPHSIHVGGKGFWHAIKIYFFYHLMFVSNFLFRHSFAIIIFFRVKYLICVETNETKNFFKF